MKISDILTDDIRAKCIALENLIAEWVADNLTDEMLPQVQLYFQESTIIVLIEQVMEDF